MGEFLVSEVLEYSIDSKEYLQYRYDLLAGWESVKSGFTGSNVPNMRIPFPKKEVEPKFEKYNQLHPSDPIVFQPRKSTIRLPVTKMQQFFEYCFNPISEKISEILNNVCNIDYIFLVGGFAMSKLLQDRIIFDFETTKKVKKVIIPSKPYLAIVEGALIYSRNSEAISSRVMNRTYGISVNGLFIEGVHDEKRKLWDEEDRCYRCINVFSTFVRRGEVVQTGHQVSKTISPYKTAAAKVQLKVYCSKKKEVLYIDEPEVVEMGCVNVDLSFILSMEKDKRKIQVNMIFGGEFIKVKAICVSTGKEQSADFSIMEHI